MINDFDYCECFFAMADIRGNIPEGSIDHKPGVYAFIGFDDKVLYIGKAAKLRNRIMSYHTTQRGTSLINKMLEKGGIQCVVAKLCDNRDTFEIRMIHKYKPILNTIKW